MKTRISKFWRLVPFHPYWLFVCISNALVVAFATLLVSIIVGGPIELPLIIGAIAVYLVSIPITIFNYITVDETQHTIQAKGLFKILTLQTIAISDIQEIQIDSTKRWGSNLLLRTAKKDYKLSVDNHKKFAEVLKRQCEDITIAIA